jgi:hypothetical protein
VRIPLNGRGDGALESLIVLAFLEDPAWPCPALSGPEPELDPADQRALDGLGPDLLRRILEEDSGSLGRSESPRST